MRCVSTVPSSVSVDDAGRRSLKDGLNEDDSADDDDDDVDVDVDVDVDAIRASLASDVVNNRGESSSFPFSEKWMFLFSFSFSLSSPSPDDVDEKNSDKSEIGAGGRCRDVVLDLLLLQCCIILLRIDSDIYDERGG